MSETSPDCANPREGRDTVHAAIDAAALAHETEVMIRPLASIEEYKACAALQHEVWGPGYGEVVPASVLQIAPYVGGLVLGAFTPEDELVGFVFGLTGVKDGKTVHWSHILGVREIARNLGVGRMLKEYQRAELARLGIPEMRWTFDPLVAKNAHFNLNRLGASVVQYARNMYGATGSPLHLGMPTDRLIAACPTVRQPDLRAPSTRVGTGDVPILTSSVQSGDAQLGTESEHPTEVWIEIPTDIQRVIARSPYEAAAWRTSVRYYFEWAFRNGYTVTGLHHDPVTSRSFYTLEIGKAVH